MTCKNCSSQIQSDSKFCSNCGGKIHSDRITGKGLWKQLISRLVGWDNRFLGTICAILKTPQAMFNGYFAGARSKYNNPFKFFGIAAAISLIVFNIFSDKFMLIAEDSMKNSSTGLTESRSIDEIPEHELAKMDKHSTSKVQFKS